MGDDVLGCLADSLGMRRASVVPFSSRSHLADTLPRVSSSYVFLHSNSSHSFVLLLNCPFRHEARFPSPRNLFFVFCSVFTRPSFGASAWACFVVMPHSVWVRARGGSFTNNSQLSHGLESHGDEERGREKHEVPRYTNACDIHNRAECHDNCTS